MYNFRAKIVASALTILCLGGAVAETQPTPNDLDLDLPAAVQGVPTSPVIMRIGEVVNIVEGTNVTVRISGSPTLVNASYLFPSYRPILMDRVMVLKQDAQWAVIGVLSGELNTQAFNPSFEDGPFNSGVPQNWTYTVTDSSAGTPTVVKDLALSPIQGQYVAHVNLSPGAALASSADLISTRIPATPGSVWTGGVFMYAIELGGGNSFLVATAINFYDAGGALISTGGLANAANLSAAIPQWFLIAPDAAFPSATAPANTASVALLINMTFFVLDTGFTYDIYFDYAMLRRVS